MSSQWKEAERRIAALLGGRRVPITGRERGDVPDIEHPALSIEVKHRKKLPSLPMKAMEQADAASKDSGKPSLVVLHQHGQPYEQALIIMRLGEFRLLEERARRKTTQ